MKTLTNFGRLAFLLVICALLFNTASAQTKKLTKKEKRLQELKSLIESKNFHFEANYMRALGGGGRALDTGSGLTISPDGMVSQLPYAGVAMQASLDTKSVLDFTSKNYDYSMLSGDNGGWQITVVPKDYPAIVQMVLTIDDEGEATLAIKSTTRDPISFTGSIEAIRH